MVRADPKRVYVTLEAWFGHGPALANRATEQLIKANLGKHTYATMNGIIDGAWMRK